MHTVLWRLYSGAVLGTYTELPKREKGKSRQKQGLTNINEAIHGGHMVSEKTRSISCSAETRRSEPHEHGPAGVDPFPDVRGTGHQNKPRACSWKSSTSPVPDGTLGSLPSQSRLGPRKASGGERSRVGEAETPYGQAGASREPACL